ncbi:MAG TPA: hypothetical protein VGK73_30315 [Polyangiaceae bacterium]
MSEERDTRDTEPPAFAEMDPKALLVYMADAMFEMRQAQRVMSTQIKNIEAAVTLIGNALHVHEETPVANAHPTFNELQNEERRQRARGGE